MDDSLLSADLSPVQWTTAATTRDSQRNRAGDAKAKGAKKTKPAALLPQGAPDEDAEAKPSDLPSHEIDSFA